MWEVLPIKDKQEYQRLILAFASLTDMFTQKSEDDVIPSPIVNSKFQETVFQKAFHAFGEDIGNTSYDASLCLENDDGTETKFMIGIKTFGIASGDQKIAQFKTNHGEWSKLLDEMERNAYDNDRLRGKEEINKLNHDLYLTLAKKIATIRNQRIDSSKENLRGFDISKYDNVDSVYHVLMPSKKGKSPKIYVGETSYNKIDIENIKIQGCMSARKPSNFVFEDGFHIYKFTSADSQLLMKFNNSEIVIEDWDVIYADDAYGIFSDIAKKIYDDVDEEHITDEIKGVNKTIESYSWSLLNDKGEVESFSGFNNFFGVGSKLAKDTRESRINKICDTYKEEIDLKKIHLKNLLYDFLMKPAPTFEEKMKKVDLREKIKKIVIETKNENLLEDINKLIYRPIDEMYIPIPNSKKFHNEHPDFFGKGIGTFKIDEKTGKETSKLALPREKRKFNLIFEPSGDSITSYVTGQDNGKAIQSFEKQSYLGKWILRKVFQLKEYEPLTSQKLEEIGINGIRLYKKVNSDDIHLQFIWIDTDHLPKDLIQ
ncbi:hypothetical protein [Thomasclavelia cocleata]|uniref:hypothetical protein n=1 Tax=Thomasclavelia cocleata TaxID=69824 RepID=UPI00242D8DA1|nr:hypothetical protein [Thomasclavelia cocleata]